MFVKKCGNCMNAAKPIDGYYSDPEVRFCLKLGDFVKASEVAEEWDCDIWEWDCIGESPEELREEAIMRVYELKQEARREDGC